MWNCAFYYSSVDRRFVDFVKHISPDDWVHICNQICNHLLLLNKLSISLHFVFVFFVIGSVSFSIALVNGFLPCLCRHTFKAGENFFALIYHKLYQIKTALCRWCIVASHHRNYRWNKNCVHFGCNESYASFYLLACVLTCMFGQSAVYRAQCACSCTIVVNSSTIIFYHLMSDELFCLSDFPLDAQSAVAIDRQYSYFVFWFFFFCSGGFFFSLVMIATDR